MTLIFQSGTEKQLDIFQHDQQLGGISIAELGGTVPLTSGFFLAIVQNHPSPAVEEGLTQLLEGVLPPILPATQKDS